MKAVVLGAVLSVFAFASSAQAGMKFSLLGSYGQTSQQASVSSGAISISVGETDESFNAGAGALLEIGLVGPVSFELASVYTARGYKGAVSADEVKFNTLTSTALVRVKINQKGGKDLPVTVGLGAYYSAAQDDTVTFVDASASTTTQVGFGDGSTLPLGAIPTYDFGVVAAIGADLPISSAMAMTLDIRYLHGLKDTIPDNSSLNGNWSEVITLVGFSFLL